MRELTNQQRATQLGIADGRTSMARRILATLAMTAWALWLGGLGTLFVAVTALFRSSRELGKEAAPVVFVAFERYQIVVGVLLWIALLAWKSTGKVAGWRGLFWATLLGLAAAITMATVVSPRMESLRQSGQSRMAEFKRLHGLSEATYASQAIVLFIGGTQLLMQKESRTR